jgi:hypothetical protein
MIAFVAVYLSVPPLFSSIDAKSADDPVDDYFIVEDPFCLQSNQASKTPLIISISPIPFSLMLALEIAAATVYPILMHSLFIVTCY